MQTVSKSQTVAGNTTFECQIPFTTPEGYTFLGVSNIKQTSWGECLISMFSAQNVAGKIYVNGKNVSGSSVTCSLSVQLIFVKSEFVIS